MKYCYECGTKLEDRFLEGEGMIPYCTACNEYRFPIFSTAVIMIVQNPAKDKMLLIQQYGRPNNILVAGYINRGETAEETVKREVMEELGLEVEDIQFNQTGFLERNNVLMLNFSCVAKSEDLSGMTKEVDKAAWYPFEEAKKRILHPSLAEKFLLSFLAKNSIC